MWAKRVDDGAKNRVQKSQFPFHFWNRRRMLPLIWRFSDGLLRTGTNAYINFKTMKIPGLCYFLCSAYFPDGVSCFINVQKSIFSHADASDPL